MLKTLVQHVFCSKTKEDLRRHLLMSRGGTEFALACLAAGGSGVYKLAENVAREKKEGRKKM